MLCAYLALNSTTGRLYALFWQPLLCSPLINLRPNFRAIFVHLLPARAHKFARVGTSDYTGIRTSHVFRPGIEPRSTAWKSRRLTTQPATHITHYCSLSLHAAMIDRSLIDIMAFCCDWMGIVSCSILSCSIASYRIVLLWHYIK